MTIILSNKKPYTLNSLIKCKPPFHADEKNWFKYKISQGANTITGYKCGEYDYVLQSVQVNIEQLNQRQTGSYKSISITKPKRSS